MINARQQRGFERDKGTLFAKRSVVFHGTNAQALTSVLKTGGKLLPREQLEKQGVKVLTGESMGTTPLNNNFVSGISIAGGELFDAQKYAKACADGKIAVTPGNIEQTIALKNERFKQALSLEPAKGSLLELAMLANKKQIEYLEQLQIYFQGLSKTQQEQINQNSALPVVLYGYDSGDEISPVRSSIPSERGYKEITLTHIATEPEYVQQIKLLLEQAGRTDIDVLTYEQAEKLSDYYNAYYDKLFSRGDDQDFIISSDDAHNPFEDIDEMPTEDEYDPFEDFEETSSMIDIERLQQRIKGLDIWQEQLEQGSFKEYAIIPDVHGDIDALDRILQDLTDEGVKEFIFSGDYFDRGQNNREVFDRIKKLKGEGKAICLMGNHELLLINAILSEDIDSFKMWINNGGIPFFTRVFRREYLC